MHVSALRLEYSECVKIAQVCAVCECGSVCV